MFNTVGFFIAFFISSFSAVYIIENIA